MHGSDCPEGGKANNIMEKHSFRFQPLLFALLGMLLVALFFATALMDVRRTQNTLLDVFENKGLTIIETVETIARDKYGGLMETTGRAADFLQDLERMEEGFRMQETMLGGLIELAREVDRLEQENSLTGQALENLAAEAAMQAVIVYDGSGRAILESARLPDESAAGIRALLEKGDEISFDLQGEQTGKDPSYRIAVRRKNRPGSVVLAFGGEGFRYWAARVAIQEAIEESGWRKGVHYFMVFDSRGFLLAGAGDLPETPEDGPSPFGIDPASTREGGSGRRIIPDAPERLEVYAPLRVNGGKAVLARIGLGIEEAVRIRENHQKQIFVAAGMMMLGTVLAMLLFYRLQNRHLRRVQEMKERLGQAERLSSLGRLAAGVAHEIRNPLNAVSMAVQRIQREFEPAEPQSKKEFSHIVTVVRDQIGRLNRIIEDFVGPARVRPDEFRPQRLSNLVEQVAQLAREEADARNVRIECERQDPDPEILMDPVRMHQALLNLVKNALEAIDGPGTITLTSRLLDSRTAVILIRDTGAGIPADVLKRILNFEYTTKEKGLGLGLPIAREIILAHGGDLRIESAPGKGTLIELILPVRQNHG